MWQHISLSLITDHRVFNAAMVVKCTKRDSKERQIFVNGSIVINFTSSYGLDKHTHLFRLTPLTHADEMNTFTMMTLDQAIAAHGSGGDNVMHIVTRCITFIIKPRLCG